LLIDGLRAVHIIEHLLYQLRTMHLFAESELVDCHAEKILSLFLYHEF
jgi:hypothetical protein